MRSHSPKRVENRHGERLAALRDDLNNGHYHQALESIRWILGDVTLPPEVRLAVKLEEVKALLAIGRVVEAFQRAQEANGFMIRHSLCSQAEEVAAAVKSATTAYDQKGSQSC